MAGLSRSQHLSLPFKDIELATKNFEMCIGRGGYGRVYKGELYIAGKLTTVAIKRLDVQFGQGLKEFLTEIELLTGLQHPNLISLLGYCDEGNEKIIIYEYAERGSLEKYISHSNTSYVTLTWLERLKICIDAARGLDHLHSHVGKHQTIIHRDIKSANILIDENWVAKISDFGLSKLSLAGLDRSAVISHACGTLGYCDPEYVSSGFVTKKSDVYSFGMVLFEVLCGKLCTVRDKDGPLLSARVAKDCYKNKKLDEIIDPSLRELMSSYSMSKFSEIAYGCLDEDRERRPPMDVVKKELEEILEIQKYSGLLSGPLTERKSVYEPPTPTKSGNPIYQGLTGSCQSKMNSERHQENLEILSRCIRERFGFKDGNPVAASVIYKCLLHWDAFESERTEFFNFIIENINNVLQKGDEDVTLPYWLSNASALLCLLQRNFRSNGFLTRIYQCSGVSALTNGRVTQGLTPHKHIGFYDGMSLMEARSPAILFKQQLTLCVEKIFGLIRDNLKKEISPLLFSCIQVPKNQRVHGSKPSRSREGIPQQAAGSQWEKIIEFLDSLMDRLRANHVPSFFIRKLTTQVFSFINVSLFNSFLLRQECCSFSNGEYVNSGLAELEKWIVNAKEEFAGTSWHELNYIRQAAGFLVIHQKRKKSLEEIRQDLCPALTIRQIYRISTRYWDDKYGTKGVSNEVVAEMREILNKDSQNLKSNSFLLDDDLSIPFFAEDIYMAIPVFDPTDIEAPTLLFDYPSAQFLQNPK